MIALCIVVPALAWFVWVAWHHLYDWFDVALMLILAACGLIAAALVVGIVGVVAAESETVVTTYRPVGPVTVVYSGKYTLTLEFQTDTGRESVTVESMPLAFDGGPLVVTCEVVSFGVNLWGVAVPTSTCAASTSEDGDA